MLQARKSRGERLLGWVRLLGEIRYFMLTFVFCLVNWLIDQFVLQHLHFVTSCDLSTFDFTLEIDKINMHTRNFIQVNRKSRMYTSFF